MESQDKKSIYGKTLLVNKQGKEYKITLGYTNNHSEIKAITDGNNTLAQAQAPDTITNVIFTEPTTSNGSTSTTVYNESNTPKVSFSWTQPLPRSGSLSGYDVTYQAVGTSLNTLDYSANSYTTTATSGATSINITNNVKYGTKYKVKIRASNDAGATGSYSEEFTSAAFTKVPNRPSSTSITLTLRNSSTVSYTGTSLNGFYYYNGNNFTTGSGYLFNSTQFGNNIEFYTNAIKVVENLQTHGIQNVIVIITHGIFSGKCIERLQNCNVISKVIVSDTICQKKNQENLNKLEIFSISELMGEVITNIITGGSLSLLFES